jgi:hypothetical protein
MSYNDKYKELLRLTQLKLGPELLDAALAGRAKTPESVTKVWLLAAEACSNGCLRPSLVYAATYEGYWLAVSAYLTAHGWQSPKLKKLRAATPWVSGGVLAELGELEAPDKLIGANS